MKIEEVTIAEHAEFAGGYRLLVFEAPAIAGAVGPGQFVHLRVPRFEIGVLRRPFSVFRAEEGRLSVLYKAVGGGTRAMTRLRVGERLSLMGPLGNGFPRPATGGRPVLVAGGYGVAPLSFLARTWPDGGLVFIGGATRTDILCEKDFDPQLWDVRVATDDGSQGVKGLVTVALDAWVASRAAGDPQPEIFACGPEGMLKAVGERAVAQGWKAWLSLDKRMGCAVGACLACVQRVREQDGTERWTRVCKEGPVFEAREIVWDGACAGP